MPGEKRGKGIQHLTSSYWIYDMGVFMQKNMNQIRVMAQVYLFLFFITFYILCILSFFSITLFWVFSANKKYAYDRSSQDKIHQYGFDFR